jgi:hypothetical protein
MLYPGANAWSYSPRIVEEGAISTSLAIACPITGHRLSRSPRDSCSKPSSGDWSMITVLVAS